MPIIKEDSNNESIPQPEASSPQLYDSLYESRLLKKIEQAFFDGDITNGFNEATLLLKPDGFSPGLKFFTARLVLTWGVPLLKFADYKANFQRQRELVRFIKIALEVLPFSFLGTSAIEKSIPFESLPKEQRLERYTS